MSAALLNPQLRAAGNAAFDPLRNSTARRLIPMTLFGQRVCAYANANLSIYSGEPCGGLCGFCVEKLRPLSRGACLSDQRMVEPDDSVYFTALRGVLEALRALAPSVSITGGEPSRDPRLPAILRVLRDAGARKRTLTTNGSGLLWVREGQRVIDWVTQCGVAHLNISRPQVHDADCARIMGVEHTLATRDLVEVVRSARRAGTRVRLSCVLLRGEIDTLEQMIGYVAFARSLGVDNVVFRQLMRVDPRTVRADPITRFGEQNRVELAPLLRQLESMSGAQFVKQVVGYYYYVEVWRLLGVDVVLEEADLSRIRQAQLRWPGVVHELVFHPHGRVASSWQPWDGELGPEKLDSIRSAAQAI